MEKDIKDIKERLDRIEKICHKMDRHISFINNVYDSVEKPLVFIKQKFENVMGIESQQVLPIRDKNEK